MIRGEEIISSVRSRSRVRTTFILLPMSVFREIHLPVRLWPWGSQPISILCLGPKLSTAWWDFFFSLSFHCVIENWFSVSFVALFNRILNGFSLPETSAKIIVCLCVKSHLENLLPLKVMYRLGATMWGQLSLFMHSHRKSETIDLVSIL